MKTKEEIEQKIAELKNEYMQLLAQGNICLGAIKALESLLEETQENNEGV